MPNIYIDSSYHCTGYILTMHDMHKCAHNGGTGYFIIQTQFNVYSIFMLLSHKRFVDVITHIYAIEHQELIHYSKLSTQLSANTLDGYWSIQILHVYTTHCVNPTRANQFPWDIIHCSLRTHKVNVTNTHQQGS